MVFKVIDGNLTSIFKKTQNIAGGFNIASNSINSYANAFNRLNTQQNFGARWDAFLSGMDKANPKLATYFQDLAKQGASARASIQDMYTVLLDGNTRGIGNVKSIISAFNQVDPANQQAFAQAVGQTNAQLGMYLSNLNGANASIKGYTNTLVRTTAKTVSLQIASMALNAAISFGITAAISGLVSLIGSWINAQQEAIDKANEAAQAVKEQTDDIDDYIDKIIELRQKLNQTNITQQEFINIHKELGLIQDDLIEKYGKEAEGIDLVTGSIEEQIRALYNLNKAKYEETYGLNKSGYDAAIEQIQEQTAILLRYRVLPRAGDDDKLNKKIYDILQNNGFVWNSAENALELKSDLFTVDEALANSFATIQEYQKTLNGFEYRQVGEVLTYISSVRNDWSNKLLTQNEELYAQWLKYDSDYSDSYIELIRKQANLEYAIESGNAEDIANAKAEFAVVYAKATEEAIKNGDTDVAKYLEKIFGDVINVEDEVIDSNNSVAFSVTSLTDTFTALKEVLEDIIKSSDKYKDAMSNIASGSALTAEEVASLLEIDPTLFDKFTKVDNGWTISPKDLRDSYNQNIKDAVASKVGGTKEEFETALEQGNSRLLELQKQRNEILSLPIPESAKQEQLKSIDEQLQSIQDTVQDAKENLGLIDFYSELFSFKDSDVASEALEKIKDAFSDTKQEIENYNNSISNINDTINTLNEGNSLSYDEMTELVNLYPQLQDKVIKTADGYTIEISALEGVRTQSYQTRNDYIDNQIEMLKTTLETTRERIRLYYAEIGALNNYYEAKKAFEDTEADRQTIASIAELIKILESYKSEVLDPDNSSSSKDTISGKLQNQIDYYKMLLEAIGIVSDKVVEGLEKEKDAIDQKIDALNDEKDALQEKNDEQQRELDLIEAKNNLDKAKKQKVFVYKEGQGLVQVQDKKAVADAQKEYDDIQREIEIANIDKQIDVYDKQKEAIEDQIDAQQKYSEQFTNMENDIKDTLTVEQAKKALGTDEKGLISLDDKTINGIRDGLAKAVYDKDVEDNKENSYYQQTSFAEFLKSLGATVTPQEFASIANNMTSSVPITSMSNGMINNAQSITNNKSVTLTPTFNIYGATDPQSVTNQIHGYMKQLLTETINSIK